MPKHKAATPSEAMKLVALMQNHGAWAEIGLDHRTITYANTKAWQKVRKQRDKQLVIAAAAESKSMMETEKLI